MVKYTFLYFKSNGRTAGIKLMLDYLKVPFEEKNFEHSEWPAIKPTTPFGQVPVLYVDDDKLVLPETLAIYRYLASKHGAVPDSLEDRALCDAYADHVQDYMSKIVLFILAIFEKKPKERILEYREDASKFLQERLFPDLQKQLEKNGTGWMVGGKPTWLDFFVADTVDNDLYWKEEGDDEVPEELLKHREKVFGLPGLEKRVEERKHLFPPKDLLKF
ncbi:hypothetical protein FO519_004675 [Halicephalobus sp. NKZ332]|nr:hypothetical protein FO519_004675 [Halicephalobus sp. NKZ332]